MFYFKEQKITKVSVFFRRIWEIETMSGTFFFEDGTSKLGNSYNNNTLSGNIDFSDEEDSIPIKNFMDSFMENSWTQYIGDSIDNFSGPGKSIDYEFDEFEDYEEGNSEGCDWEADHDPSEITLYFTKSKLKLVLNYNGNYEGNASEYNKKEVLDLIKESTF